MSLKVRNPAIPPSFPLWPGVMSGGILLGLGWVLGPFPSKSLLAMSSLWISASTLFYLVTILGNYIRIKKQYDAIPSVENPSLEGTPDWFQQSVGKVYETAKTKIHTEKDLLDAIGAAVKEMRAGLQWRIGWIHLLPLAAVAIACVMAVNSLSTQLDSADAYFPLQIASIEAVFCFIFMYLFVALCNAMLEAWNATVKQIVIRRESDKWGTGDPRSDDWDGTSVEDDTDDPPNDTGELKVQKKDNDSEGGPASGAESESKGSNSSKSDDQARSSAGQTGHWEDPDEDDSGGGDDFDDPFGTGDL